MILKTKISLLLVLTICVITPLNNDIFIASIPSINNIFNIDKAQWLLSFGLISVAISQLFTGALMDSYGRKPIIIIGLLIFILGGIGIVCSDSFNTMLFFRILQSIGASCSIVGAVSIAKDSVSKQELVFYTSFIFGIISVSPFIAPILGSYLQHLFNWTGSFIFLVIIGVLYFFYILIFFKESIESKDSFKISSLLESYLGLLRSKEYMRLTIINCVSYISLFSIISISSLVIIDQFQYSVIDYGHIFLLFSSTLISMNILVPYLSNKYSLVQLIRGGVMLILIGSILMTVLSLFYNNIYSFVIPCLIIGLGCGIIRPTASAAVMQIFPSKMAGKTIAFYGFCFYITSGVATMFTQYLVENSQVFFGVFLTIISCVAFIIKIDK
jgi:DHA1 family bicyclomycin/chloramphenicol resistance-like MFS transporter